MSYIRSGLTDYVTTGIYSPEFIDDVNLMIRKMYGRWKLYEDFDEFSSSCWSKIATSITIYNKDCGSLSTYLFNVIYNEATRIYSKHKRMSEEEINTERCSDYLFMVSQEGLDLHLRDLIYSFAKRAYSIGVYIDQKSVYKNYISGYLTPAVKAFMWCRILTSDSGVYL